LIELVRLNAWLDKPSGARADDSEKPTTNWDMLKQLAFMSMHRRSRAASALLERARAPIPSGMVELFGMFQQLASMRDVDGMVGRKRMTPTFIRDGAALFGWSLTPDEALAIARLDVAELYPGSFELK
jgi:hypothetical protein